MATDLKDERAVSDAPSATSPSPEHVAESEFRSLYGSGAILTSERRLYDPDKMHNDWSSVGRLFIARPATWARRVTSPAAAAFLVVLVVVGLLNLALFSSNVGTSSPTISSSSSSSQTNTQAAVSSVPDATQTYGAQPAKYALDADGAKHFTFTAEQVMWQPVKGHKVLAWTLDGTVPGPTIRVNAGDHVRVTISNHFPESTTIHFHGLEIP